MKIMASLISLSIALTAIYLWLADGAWENGAMQTSAMIKTLGFSAASIIFFALAHKFSQDK